MNKHKKVDITKTLIRSAVQIEPKCKIVTNLGTTSKGNVKTNSETQIDVTKTRESAVGSSTDKLTSNNIPKKFNSPELYSTLKFSKKIDDIIKPRKTKSCSDVDKKLAADEKVTRKVNFPYDQPIYKDLISLKSDIVQSHPVIFSRAPLPLKDTEPQLSDFTTPRIVKDYYFLPKVKIEHKPMLISSNNLRLYKILQTCE